MGKEGVVTIPKVIVSASHDGYAGNLTVNGHDLSNIVSANMTIAFNEIAEYAPVLTLQIHSDEFAYDGDAIIRLTPAAEAALVAIGWTPPPNPQKD